MIITSCPLPEDLSQLPQTPWYFFGIVSKDMLLFSLRTVFFCFVFLVVSLENKSIIGSIMGNSWRRNGKQNFWFNIFHYILKTSFYSYIFVAIWLSEQIISIEFQNFRYIVHFNIKERFRFCYFNFFYVFRFMESMSYQKRKPQELIFLKRKNLERLRRNVFFQMHYCFKASHL